MRVPPRMALGPLSRLRRSDSCRALPRPHGLILPRLGSGGPFSPPFASSTPCASSGTVEALGTQRGVLVLWGRWCSDLPLGGAVVGGCRKKMSPNFAPLGRTQRGQAKAPWAALLLPLWAIEGANWSRTCSLARVQSSFARLFKSANARPARRPSLVAGEPSSSA